MAWQYWSKKVGSNSLFPNEVANLSIWYDVSDTGTITKDGSGLVSQLDDKSGNAHHLSQATSGMRPIWTANQFKGFDVIRFTAANSHHLLTAVDTVTANDYFAVIKPNTASSSNGTMYSNIGSGTSTYFAMVWITGTNILQSEYRISTSTTNSDNVISDPDGGTIINNYKNSSHHLLKTSDVSTSVVDSRLLSGIRTFSLGRLRLSSTPVYGSFDFIEIFAYSSAVSDSDRVKLWQYLSDKYSLTKPTL